MMNDYAETLLESMKIVAENCLTTQKFDETIIATVVDDANRKLGHYIVTDGAIKFDAYSDSQNYKINDVVRVTILKGDYSQKKYIVGKGIVDKGDTAVVYSSPLNEVLVVTDNLFYNQVLNATQSLKANSNITMPDKIPGNRDKDCEAYCLWISSLDEELKNLQQNNIYDAITLTAKFKTLFNGYSVVDGSYGLWVDLHTTIAESGIETIKRFYLDTSGMFGDPYNFLIFSKQEMKITLSDNEKINSIAVWFYQRNNFKYKKDNGTVENLPVSLMGDNIFVTDIQLKMGTDLTKIEEDKLVICSQDDLNYNVDDTETSNYKMLELVWYNKDDDNKYVGFGDGRILRDDDGNIIPYDEIEYIKTKQEDNRLLAEQNKINTPNDAVGLELSADFTELQQLLPKVQKFIFTNLFNEFKAFRNSMGNEVNDDIKTFFNEWLAIPEKNEDGTIKSEGGYFYSKSQPFQETVENIQNYYRDGLAFAAACDRKKGVLEENSDYISIIEPGYDKDNNQISIEYKKPTSSSKVLEDNIVEVINFFLIKLNEDFNNLKVPSQFQGIYDAYQMRINSIGSAIQSLLDLIVDTISYNSKGKNNSVLFIDLFDRAVNTFQKKEENILIPWSPKIQDIEYDNLYCTYWYKYNEGYKEVDDPFVEENWERIRLDANGNEVINIGLPFIDKEYEGDLYPTKLFDNKDKNSILQIKLDNKNAQEKYRAILIYNHEVFQSNEILFTNSRPLIEDKVLNNITIEHSTNSKSSYPLYGVDNELINASDSNKSRYVKLRYLNEQNNFDDNQLIDALVYWYIPKNATMLTYDVNDYDGKFTIHETAENIDNDMAREGYVCFYKKISLNKNNPAAVNDSDCYFPYRIKSYFTPSQTNNTIYCVVVKGQLKLETFISFDFSSFGSNGTNYTLRVRPQHYLGRMLGSNIDPDAKFSFEIELYDYNNELVKIVQEQLNNAEIQLIAPGQFNPIQNVLLNITAKGTIVGEIALEQLSGNYWILSASIPIYDQSIEKTIQLTGFYAIPTLRENYYFEGPSTIIYDSSGGNPVYYKNSCKLFTNEIDDNGLIINKEVVDNVTWSMGYYYTERDEVKYATALNTDDLGVLRSYAPTLSQNNIIIPSLFYLHDANLYPVLFARKQAQVCWIQPILLMQNRYPSAMLNFWDGQLQINEENGTILSSMVGAGKKNTDNSFSGVLMGDITRNTGINIDGLNSQERTLAHNHTGIGIYGFDYGEQSFGFNIDGSAFIGKSGAGRISFDGTHGFIYSQNWLNSFKIYQDKIDKDGNTIQEWTGRYENPFKISEQGQVLLKNGRDGMAIDLQNGHIDAYNFRLTSGGIYLNSSPENYANEEDQYYFKIGNDKSYIHCNKNGELIVNVESTNLRSNNFDLRAHMNDSPSQGKNTSIILSNTTEFNTDGKDNYFFVGVWDSQASNQESYIRLANDGTLRIKTPNFSLDKSGNVSIVGNITAKGGNTFHLRADNTLDYWDSEKKKPKNKRTLLLKNATTENKDSSYFFVGELQNNEAQSGVSMTKGIRYGEDNKLTILTENFKVYPDGSIQMGNGCSVTAGGELSVKAANISGTLTATQVGASNLTVKSATTASKLTVKKKGNVVFSADATADTIKLGDFTITEYGGLSANNISINPGAGVGFDFGNDEFHVDADGIKLYGILISQDNIKALAKL